jgi:hypothetical protein
VAKKIKTIGSIYCFFCLFRLSKHGHFLLSICTFAINKKTFRNTSFLFFSIDPESILLILQKKTKQNKTTKFQFDNKNKNIINIFVCRTFSFLDFGN